MGYPRQTMRRACIPKGAGRFRPLGVPCFYDCLVRDRLSLVLQAVWEPEFMDSSYGFRPGRGTHDALPRGTAVMPLERTKGAVDAAINPDRSGSPHRLRPEPSQELANGRRAIYLTTLLRLSGDSRRALSIAPRQGLPGVLIAASIRRVCRHERSGFQFEAA